MLIYFWSLLLCSFHALFHLQFSCFVLFMLLNLFIYFLQQKKSLYKSAHEFQCLIRQVLSWDIRSFSQRSRPHISRVKTDDAITHYDMLELESCLEKMLEEDSEEVNRSSSDTTYHLILESLDISYRINCSGNVLVEQVSLLPRSEFHSMDTKI